MNTNTTKTLVTRMALGLAMAVLVGTAGSKAQRNYDMRNFWALNNTGRVISSLYVSPHNESKWGRDVLENETLPSGMGAAIVFQPDVKSSCYFDFKLTFVGGGTQVYQQGRNVCALGAVQFNDTTSLGYGLPQ